jgi:D-alanyl-D-alanine carboxypeptidase (penicillin-binding protein 5/6)
MTADAVLSTLPSTSTVRITREAVATQGDSKLRVGDIWQLGALIKYGLLVSSNDAMAAAAQSAGADALLSYMNERAGKLGLAQSFFLDPTGLDLTSGTSGAYGSARDVAYMTAAFYKKYPTYFESTLQKDMRFSTPSGMLIGVHPTIEPLLDVPGLIGAKTGYTDLAGGNLVVAFEKDIGHPLIAVVLHSSEAGRFLDMRALIAAAREQN